MNDKITTFLNSDLLEKYLVGETTSVEAEMVEAYIAEYPEVEKAYNTLQLNLEIIAKSQAVDAPKHILNNVLEAIDDAKVIPLKTPVRQRSWYKFTVAASIAALFFAGTAGYFYNQTRILQKESLIIDDEIVDLRSDIDQNNKMLENVMRQLMRLNNPETQKYIIRGNDRAKDLKTVAYINPKDKTSMIDVVSLPQLPEEQCYQIWAELQDRMVNLGILTEADRKLKAIPYTENALGLNITIEPKGGNNIASTENTVAEISLENIN